MSRDFRINFSSYYRFWFARALICRKFHVINQEVARYLQTMDIRSSWRESTEILLDISTRPSPSRRLNPNSVIHFPEVDKKFPNVATQVSTWRWRTKGFEPLFRPRYSKQRFDVSGGSRKIHTPTCLFCYIFAGTTSLWIQTELQMVEHSVIHNVCVMRDRSLLPVSVEVSKVSRQSRSESIT